MEIDIKINFDLKKLDIGSVSQIGFVNSSQALVRIARKNSPFDTGTLKNSIGVEAIGFTTDISTSSLMGKISKFTKNVRIGSRKVVYAVRREFENKKNPSRKFYMKRTGDIAGSIVQEKFTQAVEIVKKSI